MSRQSHSVRGDDRHGRQEVQLSSAQAQSLPRSVTIGTNPPGTVLYALASGLAKVVGQRRFPRRPVRSEGPRESRVFDNFPLPRVR